MSNVVAASAMISKEFSVSEAIKVLRTNLFFTGVDKRVVALTSFSASEGKSTLSLQLAAAIAETGKRVLLLDTDLRRSVLLSRLRHKGKTMGLSHYLSGMANADEIICPTDVENLYIVFAGARVPNPAELLDSPAFEKLIPALKDAFDYVIVDSSPLGQVVDCAVIAPKLDGVIMVIDATNNSYRDEKRIKQQLDRCGARILGAVLNRIDNRDHRYGYYYY